MKLTMLLIAAICLLPSWVVGFGALGALIALCLQKKKQDQRELPDNVISLHKTRIH